MMNSTLSLKILLVDDEEIVRATLKGYLDFLGHEVHEVSDGFSGLKALKDKEYDVAVSDIRMPGIDGFSFIMEARKLRPNMPIMLISGHGDSACAEDAFEAGAVGLCRKPFKLAEFEKLLVSAVSAEFPERFCL